MMVNHIKPLLYKFIGTYQNGFVPGRQILDVVIIAHEVIHSMEKCENLGMDLKLDNYKSYDKRRRDFLIEILIKLGFKEDFIRIVQEAVNMV